MPIEWDEETVNRLRELWSRGLTANQIATELGNTTRNAVIGKVHRLGLRSRPSPIRGNEPTRSKREKVRKGLDILALTEFTCRWPFGHPNEPDFHFCGKMTVSGFPYCDEHVAMAYQRGTARKDALRRAAQERQERQERQEADGEGAGSAK